MHQIGPPREAGSAPPDCRRDMIEQCKPHRIVKPLTAPSILINAAGSLIQCRTLDQHDNDVARRKGARNQSDITTPWETINPRDLLWIRNTVECRRIARQQQTHISAASLQRTGECPGDVGQPAGFRKWINLRCNVENAEGLGLGH
jgi:hypothetical protein